VTIVGKQREDYMKTKVVFLAVSFAVLAAKPIWAQQQNPDPNLMAQLEQRLAESDYEARTLKGGPEEVWLLRKLEIEKTINQLKAGQSVDLKEIDRILEGQVNY
jgi:hypothetical protein